MNKHFPVHIPGEAGECGPAFQRVSVRHHRAMMAWLDARFKTHWAPNHISA